VTGRAKNSARPEIGRDVLSAIVRRLPDIRGGRKPWSEAVVSKAKDRADSSLCRALGLEEAQVLT
jgi:hypothetical protein